MALPQLFIASTHGAKPPASVVELLATSIAQGNELRLSSYSEASVEEILAEAQELAKTLCECGKPKHFGKTSEESLDNAAH